MNDRKLNLSSPSSDIQHLQILYDDNISIIPVFGVCVCESHCFGCSPMTLFGCQEGHTAYKNIAINVKMFP